MRYIDRLVRQREENVVRQCESYIVTQEERYIVRQQEICRSLFQNALGANLKINVAMPMLRDHVLEKSSSKICTYVYMYTYMKSSLPKHNL